MGIPFNVLDEKVSQIHRKQLNENELDLAYFCLQFHLSINARTYNQKKNGR